MLWWLGVLVILGVTFNVGAWVGYTVRAREQEEDEER